jgi:hypothetical protein
MVKTGRRSDMDIGPQVLPSWDSRLDEPMVQSERCGKEQNFCPRQECNHGRPIYRLVTLLSIRVGTSLLEIKTL